MDISQILTLRYQGQEWVLRGEEYEGLEWLSDSQKPSLAELKALWPSVQAEVKQQEADRIAKRQELLDRLGITEDEAKLLLS